MRRSNLQRGAADVLATLLAAAVPAIPSGQVHAIPEDWNAVAAYPAIGIVPQRSTLTTWQDQELDDTVDGQLLVECGTFEGTFSVRLLAPLAAVREDLEPQILEAFMQDPDRPGVLLGTINNVAIKRASDGVVVASLYNAPVAFALDNDEWRDELVFASKRESFLEVTVQYPLLILRAPVYAMNEIFLAMTHDLSSTNPSIDEMVQVNSDGSLTRA
jgi:hypothetical protein